MNKVKMFFVAAALLLTTAGVFAGKAKFTTIDLYASSTGLTGSFYPLSTGGTLGDLQTSTNGSQVTITDHNNNPYGVYSAQSSTAKVFSTSAW